MGYKTLIAAVALLALAACGSSTAPNGSGSGYGGGTGGTGGTGGGGPAGSIRVGDIYFRSAHNGTQNPAVDTVAAGSTVSWTWDGGTHSIVGTGTPPGTFRNSVVMSGANSTYSMMLNTPGRYTYQCGVHGAEMTGVIVVQ